jgi:hypothetical protein
MCDQKFLDKEYLRAKSLYNKQKHQGFANWRDMADWMVAKLKEQKCCCYFCDTSIHDINKLIDKGLVAKRKTGNSFRGPVLEIDKNDELYTKELCVLACHYCNNDKSNLMSADDYKKHFGPNRKKYFDQLIKQL